MVRYRPHPSLAGLCTVCAVVSCRQGVYVEEGDPEDDEAEIKLVWRGGDIIASSQNAADLGRV